jgi:hypothetical protein
MVSGGDGQFGMAHPVTPLTQLDQRLHSIQIVQKMTIDVQQGEVIPEVGDHVRCPQLLKEGQRGHRINSSLLTLENAYLSRPKAVAIELTTRGYCENFMTVVNCLAQLSSVSNATEERYERKEGAHRTIT